MNDTIYKRFRLHALVHPEHRAVVTDDITLTYADLDRLVDAVVTLFPNERPHRVGIMMSHTPLLIASMLAVLKRGAAYVPVEPSFPPERIRYMMDQAEVDFIIADGSSAFIPEGHQTLLLPPIEQLQAPLRPAPQRPVHAHTDAYILYTSGTTGHPKGVVITNGNVCNYAHAFHAEFAINDHDVMLQHSVCSFDIFTEEVFGALLNGASLAIPDAATHDDIDVLMSFVNRHGVTIISGFPYLLLEFNKLESIPSSVRLLISGGDVLRASYIDRLRKHVMIYNTYGPSETTVCATYQRVDNIEPLADGTYPIGHAVEGVRVDILDERLRPVPRGVVGEICISGRGVGHGYLRKCPESANFVTLPSGEKVYRSGDLGYTLPDGTLAFLHRKDKQVMIMGKRVECDEVQTVIANCPEVESAFVMADTDTGGLTHLTAYIVPRHSGRFSLDTLKQRLRRYLTSFMIPEFFVTLAAMPLTPNGKPDTEALKAV